MDQENSPWQYKPDDGSAPHDASEPSSGSNSTPKRTPAAAVSWEAAEFIEHPHPAAWYLSLSLSTAVLAVLVFLIARDYVAAGTIVAVGVIVGIFANQKPGQARYEIMDTGLAVNGKTYSYGDYKSFAVIREGNLSSVNLFPLKRFMPPLSAYFDPKDEQTITNALGNYLPYEDRKLDSIERLSRRLRL